MAVGWFATKREAALVRISTSKSEAMALNGEMAAFILAPNGVVHISGSCSWVPCHPLWWKDGVVSMIKSCVRGAHFQSGQEISFLFRLYNRGRLRSFVIQKGSFHIGRAGLGIWIGCLLVACLVRCFGHVNVWADLRTKPGYTGERVPLGWFGNASEPKCLPWISDRKWMFAIPFLFQRHL